MSDRGIKKFAPFKSLKGQYEVLDKMKYEKNKIPKPSLEIDQIEKIQASLYCLSEDINQNIIVSYYIDGYIKHAQGQAKKLTEAYLNIFDTKEIRIKIIDILDLEII